LKVIVVGWLARPPLLSGLAKHPTSSEVSSASSSSSILSTLARLEHDESQIRLTHHVHIMIQDHGEHVDPPLRSLHTVCLKLNEKINSFLAEEPQTPLLRSAQAQLRVSMGVVEEALEKYQCVFLSLCLPSFHLEYQTGR